jgi:hypothetical protein
VADIKNVRPIGVVCFSNIETVQAMTRKQRNRDNDWLSVIDVEWPVIANTLADWISPGNVTEDSIQKLRLEIFFKQPPLIYSFGLRSKQSYPSE